MICWPIGKQALCELHRAKYKMQDFLYVMRKRTQQSIIFGLIAFIGIAMIAVVIWKFFAGNRLIEYNNQRDGYSVKYPSSWSYEEGVQGSSVIFYSPIENDLDFFKENVNVVVQNLSGEPLSLKEYSDKAIEQMRYIFQDTIEIKNSSRTYLSDQRAHQFEFVGQGPEANLHYLCLWTIDGLKAYQFTYLALEPEFKKYLPAVQKMIKSFDIK